MEAQLRLPFLLSGVFTSEFDIPHLRRQSSAHISKRISRYAPSLFADGAPSLGVFQHLHGFCAAISRTKSHDPGGIFPLSPRAYVDKAPLLFWHASCLI